MTSTKIRPAQHGDEAGIAEMMTMLWPEGTLDVYRDETTLLIESGMCGTLPGVILMALGEGDASIGILQAGLRSHADGCDSAQPVGFIEGWFVRAEFRGRGAGRALMDAAEKWAQAHGCVEMASDALIDNAQSQRAHDAMGFEVVDRCVHFRKSL